jgi:hypothetical protein
LPTDPEWIQTGVLQRSPRVVSRRIGDETVLVPVSGERGDLENLFRLNPVAASIWEWMETPQRLPELVGRVVAEFEVDRERAETDARAFLADLAEADLVEEAPRA